MSHSMHRRRFLGVSATAGVAASLAERSPGSEQAGIAPDHACTADPPGPGARPYLTDPEQFIDVSRGNPKPHSLRGEALARARLTPETWRLEIVGDESAEVERPCRIEDGTALDLPALREVGRERGVRFLKAMQCNNIPVPLGQGLWEGVPLREVLRRVGLVSNVRRVYYWGYHNDDPAQMFRSSLGFNHALETPPGELPPLVAYRLNGADIPLSRGGPVRMVVPWAHGFKSIKWLRRIVLTNDYQANDTYALQNNDPDSYLKTAAYLGKNPRECRAGEPIVMEGTAMAGWSGLARVEYWLRPDPGTKGTLPFDDPAWSSARWEPCDLMPAPDDWTNLLPEGTAPSDVWGFDPTTGQPRDWPLRYSVVPWSAALRNLEPGPYEFRVRAVDRNGFAQPEPRPYQKSGMNRVPCHVFAVTA